MKNNFESHFDLKVGEETITINDIPFYNSFEGDEDQYNLDIATMAGKLKGHEFDF